MKVSHMWPKILKSGNILRPAKYTGNGQYTMLEYFKPGELEPFRSTYASIHYQYKNGLTEADKSLNPIPPFN